MMRTGTLLCTLLATMTFVACDESSVPSPTAPPLSPAQTCMDRAVFGDPLASPWVLPFNAGDSFRVTQSYCNPNGGHNNTFAYDFEMPMGAPILAGRDGTVINRNDQYENTDFTEGHENNVWIQHDDGTIARYTHLEQGSVLVETGEAVFAGQEIAASGASGNTGGFPHLHLEVFRNDNYNKSNTVPINFRNADGVMDERGGLIASEFYRAMAR